LAAEPRWAALLNAERWAADIAGPTHAIGEQTATKVVDGSVEVISEGQ
jgi:dipeptidase E